jgi:N-acetylglucosamine-6-phosphate deacetylase
MVIQNGTVFLHGKSFEKKNVELDQNRIKAILDTAGKDTEVYDASGCYVIPGLVDLHFHGCVGCDISDHNIEDIARMAAYELQNGITAICPATMTLPETELSAVMKTAGKYLSDCPADSVSGADLVGINLEGPFVSQAKRGAQNPEYICDPDLSFLHRLLALAPGLAKLITLAPELPGAADFIKEASKDIIISLGHSTADYRTAKEAFELGARHVTHLFNAMPPFAHRDTGIVGAAFDDDRVHVELISDGIHVSDPMIRAAFRLYTDDRIILISDSMRAAGMPDGSYTLGGQAVTVNGKLVTLADGTIAGSVTNLMNCMRYAVREAGIPLESAVKAATINPARELGIEQNYGQITEGAMADLIILTPDLEIKDIIFKGKVL